MVWLWCEWLDTQMTWHSNWCVVVVNSDLIVTTRKGNHQSDTVLDLLSLFRVLRPPGGASNITFGADEEKPVRKDKMASSVFAEPEDPYANRRNNPPGIWYILHIWNCTVVFAAHSTTSLIKTCFNREFVGFVVFYEQIEAQQSQPFVYGTNQETYQLQECGFIIC